MSGKRQAKNGHPMSCQTLAAVFAYSEKPVKGKYSPVYLADRWKPRKGKRRRRHS